MYAPKGVAALYVAPGVLLRPVVGGGGQEDGLWAGTENVASIVGLGAAAEIARHALAAGEPARLGALRDDLARRLGDALPGRVRINGEHAPRLPTTLSVRIAGAGGRQLLDGLPGVAASAGSACHSGVDAPSPCSRPWACRPRGRWRRSGCPSAAGPRRTKSSELQRISRMRRAPEPPAVRSC